jgi:hypothetical protein
MQESEDFGASTDARQRSPRWRKTSAWAIGMIAAFLTLSLYNFGSPSLGKTGQFIAGVIFPGLLVSVGVAGNAHAFNLWVAAAFNCVFYFGLTWVALSLLIAFGRKFR